MCEISTIADDWIIKGLHLHVDEVEIAVHPDHSGGIVFEKVFGSTSDAAFAQAIRKLQHHLQQVDNRSRLHREVERARAHVSQNTTALRELALGRAAEFTFLMHALKKMGI